jgi:hypothetical protein
MYYSVEKGYSYVACSFVTSIAYCQIIAIFINKLKHRLTTSATRDVSWKARFMNVLAFTVSKDARRSRHTKETVILFCTVQDLTQDFLTTIMANKGLSS